jgi:hypothetical protein
MQREMEQEIKKLADRLFTLPVEDYLSSENFLLFCRQQDVDEIWSEYLDLSRARPDLYGKFVLKNTLVLFLHHIFHSRPDDFVDVFARFLSVLSYETSLPLPLEALKTDLAALGYSNSDLDARFSVLKAEEAGHGKCGMITKPE